MESGGLDLEPSFMRPGVLSEDLEDHLGAVEDARLELQLEVALLPRAQIVVADNQVESAFHLQLAQLVDLAHADEVRGVDLGPPLHVGADDLDACGAREVGQLGHLLAHSFLSGARQEDANEKRPLTRAPGCDQSLSFLMRDIASSRRASGAVTDRRK